MPDFSKVERDRVSQYVGEFKNQFIHKFLDPISHVIPSSRPQKILNIIRHVEELERQLHQGGDKPIHISDDFNPLLKQVIISVRRKIATEQESYINKTFDLEWRETLEKPINSIDHFMQQDWFQHVNPLMLPCLTDFLVTKHVENIQNQWSNSPSRIYDEKFEILQSSSLFLKDLEYFRIRCEQRGIPFVVSFLDIDDFKSFNTQFTESAVDKNVLPIFMTALESHVFNHGYAYRIGGDEYLVLLPNSSEEFAIHFFNSFQTKLKSVVYPNIQQKLTVSIGFCCIKGSCHLTNQEIQERANWAKNHAKEKGKNCIATFKGISFSKGDLY